MSFSPAYALIDSTGKPVVATVSETERAVKVNALVAIYGRPVFNDTSDEDINRLFEAFKRPKDAVKPVAVIL